MSKYVVFVTEDEEAWEAKTDAERQEVYDADARFVRLLEQRGGKVVGGAELGRPARGTPWSTAAASPARPPVRTPSPSSSSAGSTSWSARTSRRWSRRAAR